MNYINTHKAITNTRKGQKTMAIKNLQHNDFELRDRISIQCEQRAVTYLANKQAERAERIEQVQLFIAGLVGTLSEIP